MAALICISLCCQLVSHSFWGRSAIAKGVQEKAEVYKAMHHCSASTLFMLFPHVQAGSSGKYFDLLLNRAAPTPKPAPCLPSSQASIPRPSAGPSSSSGAFPISWNLLLGTTPLLLMKSPCALLSLGNNHVLQRKQKIKNKSSILMINSGDRGKNHSKWRLFWGREGFLSKAGRFLPGHCR